MRQDVQKRHRKWSQFPGSGTSSTSDCTGQTTDQGLDISEPVPPAEFLINANSLLKGKGGF